MVWSLVKIVIFIALVAAATFGAGWVIEAGGEVRVSLGATEFSLTPLAGAVVLVNFLVDVSYLLLDPRIRAGAGTR